MMQILLNSISFLGDSIFVVIRLINTFFSNIVYKTNKMFLPILYPYPVSIFIEGHENYEIIFSWILENIPDYKKKIWVDIESQYHRVSTGGYINVTGTFNFKHKEHVTLLKLTFYDIINSK